MLTQQALLSVKIVFQKISEIPILTTNASK